MLGKYCKYCKYYTTQSFNINKYINYNNNKIVQNYCTTALRNRDINQIKSIRFNIAIV